MKQFQAVLQGLGLPEAQVQALSTLTDDQLKDFKADEYINAVRSAQQTALLNDQEFLNKIPDEKIPEATKKKIESGQYARFQNELIEVATKQLGLEDKDLTEADRKSIKGLAKTMAEKYLSKKGNTQGLQEMQNKLSEMTTALEKKDSDWQEKLDSELKKVNGTINAKILKSQTKLELSNIDGVKLNVPPGYIVDPILSKLTSKYAVVLNDNDEPVLKNKDNTALDAMEGTKKITFTEAVKKIILDDKLGTLITENKDQKQEKRRIVVGSDGESQDTTKVVVPDYIAKKIKENQSQEEKV